MTDFIPSSLYPASLTLVAPTLSLNSPKFQIKIGLRRPYCQVKVLSDM